MSNVSASIVGFLYNLQLLHYVGENGVSAYGVIMYVSFAFVAIYIGYSMGVAPIIGFNYGAENKSELQNIFRKSVTILGITNITMFVMAEVLTVPMAKIFVGYNQTLNELTIRGMRIYSVAFWSWDLMYLHLLFYGIKQWKDFSDYICYPYSDFAVYHDLCNADDIRCRWALGRGNSS